MQAEKINVHLLIAASFLCGACVMVLEMAGSRVVAPYMGTSLVVWTSLIGIIMMSLSIGYWLGGVVSDRRPDCGLLANIIAAAAIVTLIVGFAANPLLVRLASGIRNIYVASAVAAALLFAIPSVLLGMVSPFIVRLAMRSVVSSGGTVGRFSAMSSAGSILGTFLGGFVLISFFSSRTILFIVALVLGVVAALLRKGKPKTSSIFLVILPLLCIMISEAAVDIRGGTESVSTKPEERYEEESVQYSGNTKSSFIKPEGITIDTHYNTIRVMERVALGTNLRIRVLQTDPMGAQSLMYVDRPNDLYSDYTKFYDLAFYYKPDIRNVLMLGGGGYCVPKHITATRPDVGVDVVELDPGITETARNYFFLTDRPGQRIFHEDARIFLNRESASGNLKYDAVFEDVFGSSYNIPFHLTTVECMKNIRGMLSDDGVFVVNVISSIDGELFSGIYSSIAAAFPVVMIYPATYPNSVSARQNIMIVALTRETRYRDPGDEYTTSLLFHRWTNNFEPKIAAFTDAFAPVEKYAFSL
jgi:predicted membrane-bound spermidine synthase